MSQFIASPPNALTLLQAQKLLQGARYDVEVSFPPNFRLGPAGIGTNWYPFNYACPGGEFSLRYEPANTFFFLRLRNVDVLNIDPGVFPTSFMGWQAAGDVVRVRAWAEPNAGARAVGVRFMVNEGFTLDTVAADAGAALTVPTAGHLLVGADGVTPLAGVAPQWVWNDVPHDTTSLNQWADTIWFGDSTTAPFLATLDPAIAAMLTLPNGRRVVTLAARGLSFAQESTLYGNSRYVLRDQRVKVGGILAGVNGVLANQTAAAVIAEAQGLVNTINTFSPSARIELFDMDPCYGALTAPQIAVFDLVQQALRGGGGSPVVGTNLRRHSEVYNALVDPARAGFLNSLYDTGDGLHENMAGRLVMAPLITAALA